MTKQLAQMIERVKTWPVHRQADVVHVLKSMEESTKTVYKLSDEERRLVQEALDEADEGKYVSDAELKRFRNRHKRTKKKA